METRGITIEPLRSGHVPACGAIVGATELFVAYDFGPAAAERQLLAALGDDRSHLRVALDAGEVAGFAWLVARGAFDRSSYLRLIAVSPDHWGRGVGGLLLRDLERSHLSPGGLVLLASSTNTAAHHFYESLGYRQVGELPDYVVRGVGERVYFKPAGG